MATVVMRCVSVEAGCFPHSYSWGSRVSKSRAHDHTTTWREEITNRSSDMTRSFVEHALLSSVEARVVGSIVILVALDSHFEPVAV